MGSQPGVKKQSYYDYLDILQKFYDNKCCFARCCSDPITKMEIAIKKGDFERVKQLHRHKSVKLSDYNEKGETPLMMAIKYKKKNYRQIINYILSRPNEIDIEDKNLRGDTALTIATYTGNKEIVKELIEV
jgi:ankyrin repeat protein